MTHDTGYGLDVLDSKRTDDKFANRHPLLGNRREKSLSERGSPCNSSPALGGGIVFCVYFCENKRSIEMSVRGAYSASSIVSDIARKMQLNRMVAMTK